MIILDRFIRWCKGVGHGRGFGIQSPFAYEFVTNVICQKLRYYKYETFETTYIKSSAEDIEIGKILFRITNYFQPNKTFIDDSLKTSYWKYVSAGCEKTHLIDDMCDSDLCILNAQTLYTKGQINKNSTFLERIKESTVLVIMGINENNALYAIWKEFISTQRCRVSFDLNKVGIILLSTKLQKQNYIINI